MALIDVVDWKSRPGEVVFRYPEGGISIGAQLIVMENQEAILFKDGKALDSFAPGKHTLVTGNIPLLDKLVNLPFGGKTPFPAEVYFITRAEIPNSKWGTKQPIPLMDPVYNIGVPVRAFGAYSYRIANTRAFLLAAIGSWQAYTGEAIGTVLREQVIVPKLQDLISEFMIKQNITILKLAAFYDEIGEAGKAKLLQDFTEYGLELTRFAVESINIPEEDESVQRLKKALADKAEISILGEDYNRKRTFDTMEKAASNKGEMGGAMGMGMGVSMGQQMGNLMAGALGSVAQTGAKQADDPAARLKQLKEMLDGGLITKEDFEAKKKEILGKM